MLPQAFFVHREHESGAAQPPQAECWARTDAMEGNPEAGHASPSTACLYTATYWRYFNPPCCFIMVKTGRFVF